MGRRDGGREGGRVSEQQWQEGWLANGKRKKRRGGGEGRPRS
jgi:hypothetical protein